MNKLKLRIKWSKKENDFVVYYPRKADGGWILDHIIGKRTQTLLTESARGDKHWVRICGVDWNKFISVFEVDFIGELEERGFDKKTLKFEVMIDLNKLYSQFDHLLADLSPKEKEKLKKLFKNKNILPPSI